MSGNRSIVGRLRLILGFVAATALPGLFIAMPFLLKGWWQSAFLMLSFGLKITVLPALLVALPLYWWLSRSRRLSIYWAVVAGGAAGAAFGLAGAIRRIWLFGSGKTVGEIWHEVWTLEQPYLFALIGAVCGLVGWLIAFGLRVTPPASEVRPKPNPDRLP